MTMESHSGYTGGLFEDDISPPVTDENWDSKKFYSKEESLEWVKEHQPWNPSDPNLPEQNLNHIANDLHYKVAEALGLEDVNELKFYTARNSPLDRFYGIDAFFEWNGALFTIDFTVNKHKKEYKADIIVSEEDVDSEASMDALANTVAKYLKSWSQERGNLAA